MNELRTLPAALLPTLLLTALLTSGTAVGAATGSVQDDRVQQITVTPARGATR